MRKPGRLWFKDKVGGITWEHRVVSADVLFRIAERSCYAVTVEADKCIYYHRDESYESLRLLYFHETIHRGSLIPGERHALEGVFGTDDEDDYNHREESAATFYGRVLSEAAASFLKLPKVPR